MSNFEKVRRFMKTFGQEVKNKADFPSEKIVELRYKLIEEELEELKEAIDKGSSLPLKPIDMKYWPDYLSKNS